VSKTFSNSSLTDDKNEVSKLAPHILLEKSSRYINNPDYPISEKFSTNSDLLLYDDILIFKSVNTPFDEGDVLRLESDVIDCNLVVNRIERYLSRNTISGHIPERITNWPITPGFGQSIITYVYCYSNFNKNIINGLKKTKKPIKILNLNKWSDTDSLIQNFNNHPISI